MAVDDVIDKLQSKTILTEEMIKKIQVWRNGKWFIYLVIGMKNSFIFFLIFRESKHLYFENSTDLST